MFDPGPCMYMVSTMCLSFGMQYMCQSHMLMLAFKPAELQTRCHVSAAKRLASRVTLNGNQRFGRGSYAAACQLQMDCMLKNCDV